MCNDNGTILMNFKGLQAGALEAFKTRGLMNLGEPSQAITLHYVS